ncbi:hypothetical protein VTJ04DRAFT_5922 [Mycothermus thermophilus]|uniref:uncharacterized protein n=1 Tax=Humicola insolens TaxID=85995 RepID=UPI003741F0FC
MEGHYTRPALLSKFGRRDYKRFDHLTSSHLPAGRGTIGKVEIDCRFLFTKSHWGVLGDAKVPAGIIYLDIDISQPNKCRLESATVTVTLTEHDGQEERIRPQSDCPVKFTDYYGPRSLRGEESHVLMRKTKNLTPEGQALGFGAGGLGLNKEKLIQTKARWDFSGFMSSTTTNGGHNKLRWELKENSFEVQPTHSNLFHTAFAIEHNATRFYMSVHVSGKLAKLSDKVKNRLRFGEKGGRDQKVVTKIEWSKEYACHMKLDEIAEGLDLSMQQANKENVSIEIPSAMTASYHSVNSAITNENPATRPQFMPANQHPMLLYPPHQQSYLGPWFTATMPPIPNGIAPKINHPLQHLPPLTVADLRMAVAGLPVNHHQPLQRPLATAASTEAGVAMSDMSEQGSETLINMSTGSDEIPGGSVCDVAANDHEPGKKLDGESKKELGTKPGKGTGKKLDMKVDVEIMDEELRELDREPESKLTLEMIWLGITAVLVEWLGTVGVVFWGLVGVVGPFKEKMSISKGKGHKAGRRHKATEFDTHVSGHERFRSRQAAAHPGRRRLRVRRTPVRQYLTEKEVKQQASPP